MVAVNVYGGLGNQMFQYAFGKCLATVKDDDLYLDNSPFRNYELRNFELDKFNVNYKEITFDKLSVCNLDTKYKMFLIRNINKFTNLFSSIYFEKVPFIYDESVFNSKSTLFVGYWQSYKYFNRIREVLLREFSLKNVVNEKNQAILDRIRSTNSVSLHVRRGDYVSTNPLKESIVCSLEYYDVAISLIKKKIDNPTFFIFSDEIDWVKSNLNIEHLNHEYVDLNSENPEYDLELMKNCKNNIIANSSFSWWGAWLNNNQDKVVIVPKIWMHGKHISIELVVDGWIAI